MTATGHLDSKKYLQFRKSKKSQTNCTSKLLHIILKIIPRAHRKTLPQANTFGICGDRKICLKKLP